MAENKNLHDLELHESITIKSSKRSYRIIRVPGGWIYHYFGTEGNSSVFVPKNSEFKGNKDPFFVK